MTCLHLKEITIGIHGYILRCMIIFLGLFLFHKQLIQTTSLMPLPSSWILHTVPSPWIIEFKKLCTKRQTVIHYGYTLAETAPSLCQSACECVCACLPACAFDAQPSRVCVSIAALHETGVGRWGRLGHEHAEEIHTARCPYPPCPFPCSVLIPLPATSRAPVKGCESP